MSWFEVLVWVACLSPIWGAFMWEVWSGAVRPRLISAGEINALAASLVLEHGSRAVEIASIQEDRAWRYSDSFEQGKWRRVRRHLRQKCLDSEEFRVR